MDGLERFLSFGKGRHSQAAIVFPCKDEGHILQMLGCSGWKRLGKSDWKHQKSFPMNFYFLFSLSVGRWRWMDRNSLKKGELLQQNPPQTANVSLHLVCLYDLLRMDKVFSEFNTLHLRVELALHFFSPGEIKQDI